MKQPSLASLRRKLDRVFSAWIRGRDAPHNGVGPCYTCGRMRTLEASHFVPRQHQSTRWNEFNVNGCCSYCNRWLHGNLAEYYARLVRDYGQHKVDELMRLKRTTVRYSREQLEEMIERFKS